MEKLFFSSNLEYCGTFPRPSKKNLDAPVHRFTFALLSVIWNIFILKRVRKVRTFQNYFIHIYMSFLRHPNKHKHMVRLMLLNSNFIN